MSTTLSTLAGVPASDLDPFCDAFLTDPYPGHEELREAGPVVELTRYGIVAMARYDDVRAALNDWETYSSASGVGLSDFRKETPWRPPSLLLEADPPAHTRARAALGRVLSPTAVRGLRDMFEREAARLVDELIERGRFDAIEEMARRYPVNVFSDAVGLPNHGREALLPYGNIAFNAFGPRNDRLAASLNEFPDLGAAIATMCRRDVLSPDGMGAEIYKAADRGEVTAEEAALLVRSFLTAGLDTTANGIGNTLVSLVRHPDQWERLVADPSLAKFAYEEAIRYESPVQVFFRTTTRPVDVDGAHIDEGRKVLLFLAGANRDPRRWTNPAQYDITRRSTANVGFGYGIHICIGITIARLEGEVLLETFARKVKTLEADGEPRIRLNNTLRGWHSLPVRISA